MSTWGKTDTNADKPTYLKTNDRNNNNANTYGVSKLEQVSENAVYHAAHQGWVKVIPQYTDSSGQVRKKSETLVVMGDTITGNANVRVSGSINVTNGNVSISSNITAETANGNTFAIFSANVASVLSANQIVTIGTNPPRSISAVNSANVTLNAAATVTADDQKVWFSGLNLAVIGTSTRFTTELKVGDIITVGNNSFQNAVREIVSIPNANYIIVNAAFSNVNTGQSLYVGDKAWFAL